MQTALKLTTKVLPGHRIEIDVPELIEGQSVDVFLVLPETAPEITASTPPQRPSMLDFVKTVPPGPRPFQTWEEYEQHLKAERDAWDR